jgi:hypothetical protein
MDFIKLNLPCNYKFSAGGKEKYPYLQGRLVLLTPPRIRKVENWRETA